MQLVILRSKLSFILKGMHDGVSICHLGVDKKIYKIRKRFSCISAKMWGSGVGAVKRVIIGPQTRSVGPFPVTDDLNSYIMIVGDYFTKWMETYAILNQEVITVARVLINNVCSYFGYPRELHKD